ncbi:MAG: LPS-assembly protein LptD [Candidatus Electrothrix sp. AW1]|nr:LPS-assembly protein LptD [Candidatus Electrothrix sp. AX1]MCI5182825.1 LPS-assembly protein LptD [Candidatus Electrothrix gigas]
MHYRTTFFSLITVGCFMGLFWLFKPTDVSAKAVRAMQWDITADKLTKFENPASVIAEGNVILRKTEKTPQAVKKKTLGQDRKDRESWDDLLGQDGQSRWGGDGEHAGKAKKAGKAALYTSKKVPVLQDTKKIQSTEDAETGEDVISSATITTIKADWVVYDVDLGTVKLRGNVLIDIGPDQLRAREGTVHLTRETASFTDATIIRQYKDMHLEGRVIEKTGDMTYHIKDGWLVTCKMKKGEAPPWSFNAADARITDGGYALLKHVTFRIKDIPILYSPLMMLPAKRNRQTGFLFPSVSLSDRDGFSLEWPLFINISPSSDITLYSHYLAKRGFMAGIEGRYMLDQDSKGTMMVNFLHDNLSDMDNPDNAGYYAQGGYTHTNQNRYWIRGKADQNIAGWTTRLDVDLVSDQDYLAEFSNGFSGYSISEKRLSDQFSRGLQDRYIHERENKLTTLRSWSNGTSLEATLKGIDDVREEDDSKSTALWKLPEIKYSGLIPLISLYDTDVDLSWDTNYVYYMREAGVQAQRIDLYPRITTALPMLSDYLETTVGFGIRDTMYLIDDNGEEEWLDTNTENRILVDIKGEVATTLRRDFAVHSEQISAWSHTLRPFVQYSYITDPNEDHLPQFDAVDNIGDQHQITYGVNNFFTVSEDENVERDYGYMKLQQSYDFRSEASEEPFSPLQFRLAWTPWQNLSFKYSTNFDVYDKEFAQHAVESNYRNSRGDLFSFDYLFQAGATDEIEDSSSIRLFTRVGLLYDLALGYSLERSIEDSVTIAEKISLSYTPSCWSVEFVADITPENEQYMILFKLANIGTPFGIDLMGSSD